MGNRESDCYNCIDDGASPEERMRLRALHADPASWRGHFCYFSEQDPRLCVPKRDRRSYGWTCNAFHWCPSHLFARPAEEQEWAAAGGHAPSGAHPEGHAGERLTAPDAQAMKSV
eukprot:jgi/Mesen1/2205/ME000152S01296